MNQEARLDYLIPYLQAEHQSIPEESLRKSGQTMEEKISIFRGLCNIRLPEPVSEEFLEIQDAFLTEWNESSNIVTIADLKSKQPNIFLWQGDITTLAVDGIVNAANSRLLGCMQANHNCIDNIIHTRAGVQLRLDCHDIIENQGHQEPVGKAKITAGYNLPAKYVIHTVGPYIDERGVTPLKEQLLAASYRSSLALADEHGLSSIAFCCISTGVFNFPNEEAAKIAINTVKQYLKETNSTIQVVFNVFKDLDFQIYQQLLGD